MGYRVNVKNLYYAKLTKDDPNATAPKIVYDTPVKIPGIQTITITPKVQKGELYAEGAKADVKTKLDSYDLGIDIAKIPLSIRATMLGHTCANGVMDVSVNDIAPYVAVGAEIETTDGKSEYVWFYKGQAEEISEKAEQAESGIKYSTQSMKISCIARATDSKISKYADASETGYVASTGTGWFTSVPTT